MCNSLLGNSTNPKEKSIKLTFSLLMRLFEWCHEDAQSDVDMHKVMEKLMAFNDGINPLTMEVYDCLIADVKNPKECSEEDMDNAYDIGSCCAEMGCDLEDVNYSDVGSIITDIKDDGYGASNAELEKFWNGYEAICQDENTPSITIEPVDDYNEYDEEILKIINLSKI